MLKFEATFGETLEIIRHLQAKHVYLSHIEEMDQLSHDELIEVADKVRGDGVSVSFAYDTLMIDV